MMIGRVPPNGFGNARTPLSVTKVPFKIELARARTRPA